MIGLEEAVTTGGRRLERAWPARKWTAELRAEYGDALRSVGDPRAIIDGCLRAVREWGGDFPPSVASLLELVWDAQKARLLAEAQEERDQERDRQVNIAPTWWARFVMASVLASAEDREITLPHPASQMPYLDICRRHGIRATDFEDETYYSPPPGAMTEAIAEAREYGEAHGHGVPTSPALARALMLGGVRRRDLHLVPGGAR